jgi:GT2 family glycosyltransferase
MSSGMPPISAVLPTYNRLAALRVNFGSLRDQSGLSEIVVVVDGSTDGTLEWLRELDDGRIRLLYQHQRGSPAARNAGISAAQGEWILMTEDDVFLPNDFLVALFEAARANDAQVVGAPWLSIKSEAEMSSARERARKAAHPWIGLRTSPTVFPTDDLETPFINGIVLARRDVFETIRYDESLGGNAWREETSLVLSAMEAGFRPVLTPRTASFQLSQWEGGQRLPRLQYEAWAIRNNWRFLKLHRRTLERLGEIHDPVSAQADFIRRRLMGTALGVTRKRIRQLAARFS